MAKTDQSLKVFISYARKDGAAFAEELVEALDVAGFDAFLDRNDIAAGEDWEKRLEGLLAAADTVVFVVTPGSVASERCGWEIATATALAKRIIPVVAIEVPDMAAPAAISRLNYIFFSRGQSFSRSLKQLATALTTDAAWIREHTRIAELAERWIQRGRPDVLLLRGPELQSAQHWAAGATDSGPQPTDLQRSFIEASEHFDHSQAELEAQRLAAVGVEQAAKQEALQRLSRRTTLGLIASGSLAVAAAGLAYWGVNAEGRFREAEREAQEAQTRSLDAAVATEASRQDIAGQFIAYSASPYVGAEFNERAVFVKTAIENLGNPDTSVAVAFGRAQNAFSIVGARQRPLLSTSLNGEIYLGRTTPGRTLKAMVVAGGSEFVDDFDKILAQADDWAAMLTRCGFDVEQLNNPTHRRFDAAFSSFIGRDDTANTGSSQPTRGPSPNGGGLQRIADPEPKPNSLYFFVYVGEGAWVSGDNILGFSDTSAEDPDTLKASSASVGQIAGDLAESASASIIVIDTGFTLFTGGSRLSR